MNSIADIDCDDELVRNDQDGSVFAIEEFAHFGCTEERLPGALALCLRRRLRLRPCQHTPERVRIGD